MAHAEGSGAGIAPIVPMDEKFCVKLFEVFCVTLDEKLCVTISVGFEVNPVTCPDPNTGAISDLKLKVQLLLEPVVRKFEKLLYPGLLLTPEEDPATPEILVSQVGKLACVIEGSACTAKEKKSKVLGGLDADKE